MTLPSLIDPKDLDWLAALAASSPPGDFVEVGVYQGGSAERLYQIAEAQGRTLHLFDTFAGHPRTTEHDNVIHHYQGKYANAIPPDELQAKLPNARIYIGEFPGTMPDALMYGVAFVHSDVDLYAPTRAVCTKLAPHMVSGGMLYFDDYGWTECPGVKEAVCEAFGDSPALPNGKRLIVLGAWENR